MFANSPSLADIAAVTGNNRNNDGMFGGDGWWAIIIFALIFGWGGFGNGFGGYGRMYSGQKTSKYGYSHDEYMKEKQMHPGMDEASKRMRMDKLDEYISSLVDMSKDIVHGMSPEEKQNWKTGITKLLNV